MNKPNAVMETHPDTVRAGVISSFIPVICYLYISGLSNSPRMWAFVVLFAVCFVLMVKSVVDLLVWAFGLTVRFFGIGLGRAVRLVRHIA